jgi:two-component system chemotaxis sensor kinase CheA
VIEVLKVDAKKEQVQVADGHVLLRLRDKMVPVLWLSDFYAAATARSDLVERVVVVVQTSRGSLALPVDALFGTQQVVLKPLTGLLASVRAAAGCGMLRTGDVALTLDCERLFA